MCGFLRGARGLHFNITNLPCQTNETRVFSAFNLRMAIMRAKNQADKPSNPSKARRPGGSVPVSSLITLLLRLPLGNLLQPTIHRITRPNYCR